jgi:hypothetical protein
MPYAFAHEDAFMIGVVVLIVALLIVRVIVARRRAPVPPQRPSL